MKTALPCFVGKGSRMRMQSLPGSLFPSPREPGDEARCVHECSRSELKEGASVLDHEKRSQS